MLSSSIPIGLAAALTWGAADFAGGLATRRAAPSRVVLVAHGLSLLLLGSVAWCLPASLSNWLIVGGVLSGVAGSAALMVFYRALSLGAMGLSAALAGLLTAVLPVLLAIRTEGAPAPAQAMGFAVAAAAIVLIAYAPPAPEAPRTTRRALLLATVAGLGFGLQLVWLHMAAAAGTSPKPGVGGSSASLGPVLWALLFSRVGGTAIAIAIVQTARKPLPLLPAHPAALSDTASDTVFDHASDTAPRMPFFKLAALAGLLDTAGNGLYMTASLGGRLDVAAVLSSLYPGATIVLAAVILKERATRLQMLGMGLALAAVALIAA